MKVFISSTYEDLIQHRAKVAEAIERLGQQGVRMEVFGARPSGATEASLDEVSDADIFVGIYAHRYGTTLGTSTSITNLEFNHARELGKPILCFTVDEDYPWPPKQIDQEPARSMLATFKAELRGGLIRDTFTTADDLGFKVAASLGRLLLQQKVKSGLIQAARGLLPTDQALDQVSRRAARLSTIIKGARVLLVNDVPGDMRHVESILDGLSIEVALAKDSSAALESLATETVDAVVSDMARDGVPDEGLRLLSQMRERHLYIPIVFTVGRYQPERGTPAYAFGITNRVDELLNLLFDILERRKG